jgi:hypothetical protein
MLMTFGKYKGRPVWDVPDDYLQWCLHEATSLRDWQRQAIAAELKRRRQASARPPPPPPPPAGAVLKRDVEVALTTWFRRASLKHHPDRGGNHQAMVVVNEVYEELRELLLR